jgi:hypothetical protein
MSRRAARELGARFDGAVLRGELSLRERLGRDVRERITAGVEYYREVEEYDPVLRAHCGMDGQDLVRRGPPLRTALNERRKQAF